MALPNIFTSSVAEGVINRIENLNTTSTAQWGKMDVSQMLAHCNVVYETIYEDKHQRPNAFVRFMLKNLVKGSLVNEKPYKKNSSTAAEFIIKGDRNFQEEKGRLITYINRVKSDGEASFDGKEHFAFGVMTKGEWSNLFYKHLDHHLTQFGA